jgi:putative transposase
LARTLTEAAFEQSFKAMRKRHSAEEIASKLRQAEGMVAEGRRQADIAKTLDISVMTFHRWRKKPLSVIQNAVRGTARIVGPAEEEKGIAQLQVENVRLRRLVTDLLLEKVRLEEALGTQTRPHRRAK